jgi:hypothetical protein
MIYIYIYMVNYRRKRTGKESNRPKTYKKRSYRKSKKSKRPSRKTRRKYKKLRGGLKPTALGIELNKGDPQIDNTELITFYASMRAKGIEYPPSSFDSSTLHSEKPEFSRYSIEYPITAKIAENAIRINTSERGILGLSVADTESISPESPIHRDHPYNPKRVQAKIKGRTYFVKSITSDEVGVILTLFDDLAEEVSPGDIVTVERNRKGDFIIYTTNSDTIRYLDNQAQVDYLSQGGESKLGHFSLLEKPDDYQEVRRAQQETPSSRQNDKILYAGTITWRHDGAALFYNNDCGRYQPDSADGDYLAEKNSAFDKSKETATVDETDGNPKLFYRSHDHASKLVRTRLWRCAGRCGRDFEKILALRRAPDGSNCCYDCFPTDHISRGSEAGACEQCDGCDVAPEYCMNEGKSRRDQAWDAAPLPSLY